jgi:hypothetical protein
MTWQKVTVMVPPSNDNLLQEFVHEAFGPKGCHANSRWCPHIRTFLRQHFIKKVGFPAQKRVRTMAGTQIWWTEIEGERFVMPEGIKVLEMKSADNGEVWYIEKSLG